MWFRSCSHPVIGVPTQKVHGSEEDLFSFPPGGGCTKEGGGWAEPSSLAEQKFPGLQVCTSIKLLKLWLCAEPPLPAAKEY